METKLKFKIGDKVRVKSLKWYNDNKNINEEIIAKEGNKFGVFTKYMRPWCGDVIKINSVINGSYRANNGWCWHDWMLEDEPVTEEKQEVKQENKNTMETKEMTQEEIFEYLSDTKILCTSKEETRKVQEKLFELGFSFYGEKNKEVVGDAFTLYINLYKKMQFGSDLSMWVEDEARRVEPSEILAIQIKEETPKFDPKSLQPFDKVLIRDNEGDKWRCNLFCHINDEFMRKYFCVFDNWIYCIPFNDETKHLVGTNEDAPEFYRI